MDYKSELTKRIKKTAMESGFDLVGITSADPIPKATEFYKKWLKNNMHADMHYLSKDIDRRTNPKAIMPEAKSIICLGINYFQKDTAIDLKNGIVARYARGKDYHRMIEKMLKSFVSLADKNINIDAIWRYYVDYGPILERAYAEKAGLGFIGRNKNLITKEFGSWVFLSVIITDLELDFDKPAKFGCGKCRACIDACPVGALNKINEDEFDREVLLDANKCISYQTIENKNDQIPKNTAENMKGRIFGCDICQEVCPWNRNPIETKHKALMCKNGAGESIKPDEILNMSEEEFLEKYKGTPIMRAKLKGMRKNAKALLNNKN